MNKTLKALITQKLARSKNQVFVRADFTSLGGYDQVGRALLSLVREGMLEKIGYGLYLKLDHGLTPDELQLKIMTKLGINPARPGRFSRKLYARLNTKARDIDGLSGTDEDYTAFLSSLDFPYHWPNRRLRPNTLIRKILSKRRFMDILRAVRYFGFDRVFRIYSEMERDDYLDRMIRNIRTALPTATFSS